MAVEGIKLGVTLVPIVSASEWIERDMLSVVFLIATVKGSHASDVNILFITVHLKRQ